MRTAPPPVISTTQTVDYVAFSDPAVALDAMTAEEITEYVETTDRNLLKFKSGDPQFLTWKLRPLSSAEHHLAKLRAGIFLDNVDNGIGFSYSVELIRLGLVSVEGLPEGFPSPYWEASSGAQILSAAWIMAYLPSETIAELGAVVRRLTEKDSETSNSSLWPSGPASSKSDASPAPTADQDSSDD